MRLADDGTLRLSPTDLANHLSCAHLTQLEAAVLRDGLARPHRENAHADLIRSVDEPSALGEFSYEAWDTKLARHAKPNAVLQLTFYSHELERIQGRLPERMHVVLGTGEVETLRPGDFAAFYRRASARLEDAVSWAVATSDRGLAKARPQTYPYPVDHCSLCDFLELCERQWKDDDHLSQVAWIRHDQIERLDTVGISTLEALGETSAGTPIEHMAPQTFETLRHQASLQLFARRTQTHRYDLLPPLEKRGLGLLPAPSHGDLFYDIEGDPFWEPGRSLEYLHGLVDRHGAFTALWAHDRDEERRLFERLIDLFHERLAADPGLHVYHYASYETAVLKRLAAQHATREEELDELLRRDVFCDLFTVVRQSLKISYDSYSIKRVREFFMRAEAELAVLVRRAVAFRNGCKTSAVAVELSADVLRGALAMLERRDPQVATDAQEAVPWLAWRESEDEPLVLGQHTLQGFLWYVLPNKWDAPADELVDVAHALGDLLDAAGAPHRYVALCRSPETERVLRSGGDGWIELSESSGLEPPDTPLLEWSELMTLEESEERAAASLYLEAAIERGQLEPGVPGWQERQREVMEEFLSTPDESGSTPLERIRTARIEGWLGPPGRTDELGGDRRSRLTALVPLLEQEPEAEAAAVALDPLLWLLDVCADGAQLTPTNALARSIVQEAVERYPSWWLPELGKPPQQETQVYPLGLLHELALDLGLVRRRRRELRLSRRGRELRADPPALLRLVAAELADVAGFGADVGLAVALAEGDGASDIPELPILVATQLDVLTPFAGLTGPLWERRRLTEGGRTLALAILRAGATGPRHGFW